MNLEQSKQIIDYMAATWPGELAEDRIAVWCETLEPLAPAHARTALRNLKTTAEFMPSHAAFLEAYRIAERRAVESHPAVRAQHGRLPDEVRARNVQRARELRAALVSGQLRRGRALDSEDF